MTPNTPPAWQAHPATGSSELSAERRSLAVPERSPQRRSGDRLTTLPVVETFHSLQGEGLHAGRSAFFIRLAGCGVGCPWCDTKPSWEQTDHPQRSLADLATEVAEAATSGAAFAVITGGEPLEHDLGPLCESLDQASGGLPLHLETSGAAPLALSGHFSWITLSPKRHRPPSPKLLAACDELKVVVHEPADLVFAQAMAAQAIAAHQGETGDALRAAADPLSAAAVPGAGAIRAGAAMPAGLGQADLRPAPALLLQPGWNCRRGQELGFDFVRRHPTWRLSLQSHKWLGVR